MNKKDKRHVEPIYRLKFLDDAPVISILHMSRILLQVLSSHFCALVPQNAKGVTLK